MLTAVVFAALFVASNAQTYQASLVAPAIAGWNQVSYPMNACTTDANCAYLTQSPYNLNNACCATWTNTTNGVTTTITNACVNQDIDFYTSTFITTGGSSIIFNCTINKTWASYTPQTWINVGEAGCVNNSQCAAGQCCNNNNVTYAGLTNSNWTPDNYCMNATGDQTVISMTSNVTAINFQIDQMCFSTAAMIAGVTNATAVTATPAKSGAASLLSSLVALVMVAMLSL